MAQVAIAQLGIRPVHRLVGPDGGLHVRFEKATQGDVQVLRDGFCIALPQGGAQTIAEGVGDRWSLGSEGR